jgi:hypothetical protein
MMIVERFADLYALESTNHNLHRALKLSHDTNETDNIES